MSSKTLLIKVKIRNYKYIQIICRKKLKSSIIGISNIYCGVTQPHTKVEKFAFVNSSNNFFFSLKPLMYHAPHKGMENFEFQNLML